MTQQRMSQASRMSFLRANRADIYGYGNAWMILLSWEPEAPFRLFQKTKQESWPVRGGDDVPVIYSSAHAAAQAIQRVRPDMRWTVHETPPKEPPPPNPKKAPLASTGIRKTETPATPDANATKKPFANWLVETTAAAQVAGILEQIPEGARDIGALIEQLNQLRMELKK